MHSTRRLGSCMNCGEEREMAAFGLCFKCYRREDRAKDRMFAAVDRRNPRNPPGAQEISSGDSQGVMAGLSDLGVQKSDVLSIRRTLDPSISASILTRS